MAAATTAPPQPSGLARWTPSLPTNLISMLNPFASSDNAKDAPETTESGLDAKSTTLQRSRPTLAVFSQDPSVSGEPSPSRTTSVMFAEPDSQGTSENGSREGSIVDGRRKVKKGTRPKTTLSICHPPPASTTRQKLHRRPRSLLQLHKLIVNGRPVPAYEVIPSANFSVRLTRSITKIFKAKHGLCQNDLVVLKAEKYYTEEQEEEQETRDIVALICAGRKDEKGVAGKAKICMVDGPEWEAYSTPNGGYEFFTTDEHGLGITVRWVPRKAKEGSKGTARRFNFSTISPNSRRHPVIALLSKASLEINDSYKMPDPAGTTPLSTPKQRGSVLEEAMEEEGQGKEAITTDDRLKTIITITSIYVAFKEGWSPSFKYDEKDPASQQRTARTGTSPRKEPPTPVNTPPGSPAPGGLEKRASIRSVGSNILRRSSMLTKSNRTSTISTDSTDEPPQSPIIPKTGRGRADSSSTVLVHRAASNRRKNNQQATWRPDLLPQNPLNEGSREDLAGTPPRKQRLPTIISPDSTPVKEPSAAQPSIPEANGTPSPTPPARVVKDEERSKSPGKRGSTTMSDTTTNSDAQPRAKPSKSGTGKGSLRWKKIFLCKN